MLLKRLLHVSSNIVYGVLPICWERVPPLLDSLDIPQVRVVKETGCHQNPKSLVYGSHNGGQEVSKACLEQGHLR